MARLPHVLLLEDSALVTDALRVLFEQTGHHVTVARRVDEAVVAGTERAVDLLLLDVSLGGNEDGLRAIRELAERGARPRAIYALTGHDDPATRERCLAAGCADVLIKPVPLRELLSLVSPDSAATLPSPRAGAGGAPPAG